MWFLVVILSRGSSGGIHMNDSTSSPGLLLFCDAYKRTSEHLLVTRTADFLNFLQIFYYSIYRKDPEFVRKSRRKI